MMCGGLNEAKPATEEVQQLVDHVKDEVKAQAGGKDFPHLKAVSYRTQVVAGTNYFVKVDAGNEHLHLKLHKPLPVHGDKPQLSAVQFGKSAQEDVAFF